jgi:hypothetical protein
VSVAQALCDSLNFSNVFSVKHDEIWLHIFINQEKRGYELLKDELKSFNFNPFWSTHITAPGCVSILKNIW